MASAESKHLDLLVVTFNAAKTPVAPREFGFKLSRAFSARKELPDLVALSIQEIAPFAFAFIGGCFLSPYLGKLTQAVNIAASRAVPTPQEYSLVKFDNVGFTAILLFALEPKSVTAIQVAGTSFGTAQTGNKGAVGLRCRYSVELPSADGNRDDTQPPGSQLVTELTFVAAHFLHMERNLHVRNDNWKSVMTSLLFQDPKLILSDEDQQGKRKNVKKTAKRKVKRAFEEVEQLLNESSEDENVDCEDEEETTENGNDATADNAVQAWKQLSRLNPTDRKRLFDSTIFKPSSHVFVAGDLNYRTSVQEPDAAAAKETFPSLDPASDCYYPHFMAARDQLRAEMEGGRTLHGMREPVPKFPPTYKYQSLAGPQDARANPLCNTAADGNEFASDEDKVWWCFAPNRWPSWCDRILFRDVFDQKEAQVRSVSGTWTSPGQATSTDSAPRGIEVVVYDALPVVKTSDHRGVFLRVLVPLVRPAQLQALADVNPVPPPVGEPSPAPASTFDTRTRLPAAVRSDAWDRRAAARRKELVVGWVSVLWATNQGVATVAVSAIVLLIGLCVSGRCGG